MANKVEGMNMRRICILSFLLFTTIIIGVSQTHLVLALTGDVMIGKAYPDTKGIVLPASAGIFLSDVAPVLRDADLTIGNLEGALLDEGGKSKKKGRKGTYSFKMPTRYVNDLKAAGYDVFNVANNHSNDFGMFGRMSTELTLSNAGLSFCGFAPDYEYTTVLRNGLKIAVCSFSHSSISPSINDIQHAISTISQLKSQNDIVIVTFHGGAEGAKYSHVPFEMEMFMNEKRGDVHQFAHACIDAGADIVFGHGPHLPRAMELYNGHLVAYSLGNFCTPHCVSVAGVLGYAPLLKVDLGNDGRFVGGRIYSFRQSYGIGPRVDENNRAAKEIARLTLADFPATSLIISDDGTLSQRGASALMSNSSLSQLIQNVNSNLGKNIDVASGRSADAEFTRSMFSSIGYTLNPSVNVQIVQGRPVEFNNIMSGDMVFWRELGTSLNVGIVSEITGNGVFTVVHAGADGKVVAESSSSFHIVSARRFLP